MAVITYPSSILPTVCNWGLRSLTESYTSPLNGATQTFGKPGSRWKASLQFDMLNLKQGRDLMAFLIAMDGRSNRTYLINHDRPGDGANAVVVGASQVGSVLNVQQTTAQSGELVSNGTFDVDVAGWAVANTGGSGYASTFVATGGEAILTAQGTAGGRWGIPIATIPGRCYTASLTCRRVSGTGTGGILLSTSVNLGASSLTYAGTVASSSSTSTTNNTRSVKFIAQTTVTYVACYAGTNGDVFAFDNVSVKDNGDRRVYQAGDYFTVNGEFKMVTQTVTADDTGNVALPFGPMLRASPTSGAPLTFTNPTAQMMLDQSEFVMPRISGPRYSPITIPFIEVF